MRPKATPRSKALAKIGSDYFEIANLRRRAARAIRQAHSMPTQANQDAAAEAIARVKNFRGTL